MAERTSSDSRLYLGDTVESECLALSTCRTRPNATGKASSSMDIMRHITARRIWLGCTLKVSYTYFAVEIMASVSLSESKLRRNSTRISVGKLANVNIMGDTLQSVCCNS